MIQCGTPAGAGPLSPRHYPLTLPPSHPDGSSPPAGRGHTSCLPRAAHLTHSPPSSGPLVAHSRWGARWYLPEGTREARLVAGDETRLLETPGGTPRARKPNGALPTAPGASRGPAPFRRSQGAGQRGGAREPGLLATSKQGHVRTGLRGTGNPRGRAGLPASASGAVAVSEAFSSPGRVTRGPCRVPPSLPASGRRAVSLWAVAGDVGSDFRGHQTGGPLI